MTRYLRAANVKDGYLDLSDVKEMNFEPKEQRRFALTPGDVLVTEGSGSLGAVGASAVWGGQLEGTICFQNTLLRLRPRESTDPRFLAWWCRHAFAAGLFASVATGANIFHLSAERLRSIPMSVASLAEQRVIADFLDVETDRIDKLIDTKRRLITFLDERFWSSVLETIDEQPVKQVPLRRVLIRITDGPFGSSLTSAHYSDEGARVVRLGNIGFGEFKDTDKAYVSLDYYEELEKHSVSEGDLLIAGLGDTNNHAGRACVAPSIEPAIVKADCYCATVDPGLASASYLALFLSSPRGAAEVARSIRGTTRVRINLDIAKQLLIPLPSRQSQDHIASKGARLREAVETTKSCLIRQIELLKEKRQALITAAVTGEFTVPGAAA